MKITAELIGRRELEIKLQRVSEKQAKAAQAAMLTAGYRLMKYSQELVPIETGNLSNSGFVTSVVSSGRTIVLVGYSADYAPYVHERLDTAHGAKYNLKHATAIALGRKTIKRPKEQAKFLEDPLRNHQNELVDIIAQAVIAAK
jgi:hypothetical protein